MVDVDREEGEVQTGFALLSQVSGTYDVSCSHATRALAAFLHFNFQGTFTLCDKLYTGVTETELAKLR